MTSQEALKTFWLEAPEGKLCGREQAKAWALREVWQAEGKSKYGLLSFVASKLKKQQDGEPKGEAPCVNTVKEFFEKIDEDPDWHPGKHSGAKRGPKRVLRGVKLTAIQSAAKRIKAEDDEVTYSAVVAACPQATLNPATNEPVDKRLLYRAFRECCYDEGAEDTWGHFDRLAQQALDEAAMKRRVTFGNHMTSLRHTAMWYFQNIVWVDICASILPTTQRKSKALKVARKARKGWMSKSKRRTRQNMRLAPGSAKTSSSDTVKVWFVPVLTRGKLHIEPLPANFPGETQEGAAEMVARVRTALNIRFQGSTAPKILFSDRGNGFYESTTGCITPGYKQALRAHNLKCFFGDDASVQPGQLQDFLLHETTMAWMRDRLKKTQPRKPWEETVEQYHTRLKECAAHCNKKYSIDNLCKEVPQRLKELLDRDGDRIPK